MEASLTRTMVLVSSRAPQRLPPLRHDGADAALPVLPMTDTVKLVAGDKVADTIDRTSLARAQTPQMFRLGELTDALEQCAARGIVVTDEASAMEAVGVPVQLVPGSPRNIKVTVPADLELAELYLWGSTT